MRYDRHGLLQNNPARLPVITARDLFLWNRTNIFYLYHNFSGVSPTSQKRYILQYLITKKLWFLTESELFLIFLLEKRCVRDSNPWPHAWQACILTNWTNAPKYFLAVRTGLEPATPCVTGMYSNQLNYRTIISFLTAIPLNCDAKVAALFELCNRANNIFSKIDTT